jgi:hypothetical protein
MARRRKWRSSLQQQSSHSAPTAVAHKPVNISAIQPTALPTADLRRVGLIVFCLFGLLGGVVAYVRSGSNASIISKYLGHLLNIQS